MKYASTFLIDGVERVVQVLPLSVVPGFDPDSPVQENTYGVPDNVQVGWVRQGGVFIEPPDVEQLVPQSVSRAQFMLALLQLGFLDQVEAVIDASGDRVLQINWRERLTFERAHPLIAQIADSLGKTPAEVDALFRLANTL